MQKHMKNSIIFIIIVFALLALMARFTNAATVLETTNAFFLLVACLFFLFSIAIWLISWGYLIKKHNSVGLRTGFFVGFSAVYASLTPVQLGADVLRALSLKQYFGVPYSDSIAASMLVKGIKFLLIAVFSSAVILLFLSVASSNTFLFAGLISGFTVIVLAALLFLLPFNSRTGEAVAWLFGKIAGFIPPASRLQGFFRQYSNYLNAMNWKSLLLISVLSAFSLLFEFLALLFSFYTVSVFIPLTSIAMLFMLVSLLERTPFLPRGIGVVELAGFAFLSMPFASMPPLGIESIGALLVVFDFVRLVVPSLLSLGFYAVFSRRLAGLNYAKNRAPEQAV